MFLSIAQAKAVTAQSILSTSSTTNSYNLLFFLVFIAMILGVRIYRNLNGRLYTRSRVMGLPFLYTALSLITVAALSLVDNVVLLTLLFIPAGTLIGFRFGTNVRVFTRNGLVYFIRSPAIMLIWVVSLVSRLLIEIFYPGNLDALLVVDSALTLTTGILIGEAVNILRKGKDIEGLKPSQNSEEESFRINT